MSNSYDIGHKQIDQWIGGVSYEIALWNGYLSNPKTRNEVLKRIASVSDIGHPLGDFSPEELNENFTVLDVGCGMSYNNAPYIDGHKIDLHYVDPLAQFYNDISKKNGLSLPGIEFAMVEYLGSFYPKGSASLVMIHNALDHCFQPVRGILECLKVLKVGGTLYLFHKRNEAEHENYMGFHQFNIDRDGEKLIIWNRSEKYDMNDILKGCTHIRTEEIHGHIRAWIVKDNDDLPATQDNDICVLSEQIMYCISKLLDPRFTGKYQRRFAKERLMHRVASRINPKIKETIKSLKK